MICFCIIRAMWRGEVGREKGCEGVRGPREQEQGSRAGPRGVVACAFRSRMWEAEKVEAVGSLSSRPTWSTKNSQGYIGGKKRAVK